MALITPEPFCDRAEARPVGVKIFVLKQNLLVFIYHVGLFGLTYACTPGAYKPAAKAKLRFVYHGGAFGLAVGDLN